MKGDCYGCGEDNPISLGLTFELEGTTLVATFNPRPEHRGPPGYLHGGVAATCLDEAMAAVSVALEGVHVVTATLNLRFRKPVPLDGQPLRIEANREPGGLRRRNRISAVMRLANGEVAVEGSGIFVQVSRLGD